MDTADRARKHAEAEVADVREAMASVGTANSILATDKRRIEGDLRGMQQELDNFVSQIKNSEEKTKRAMADAGTYLYEGSKYENQAFDNSCCGNSKLCFFFNFRVSEFC